jgi:hypothetical protein
MEESLSNKDRRFSLLELDGTADVVVETFPWTGTEKLDPRG